MLLIASFSDFPFWYCFRQYSFLVGILAKNVEGIIPPKQSPLIWYSFCKHFYRSSQLTCITNLEIYQLFTFCCCIIITENCLHYIHNLHYYILTTVLKIQYRFSPPPPPWGYSNLNLKCTTTKDLVPRVYNNWYAA